LKHQRQKSDNASANIPAAVLRARRCVARGLCRSHVTSTDVMLQGEMWP